MPPGLGRNLPVSHEQLLLVRKRLQPAAASIQSHDTRAVRDEKVLGQLGNGAKLARGDTLIWKYNTWSKNES